MTLFVRTQGLQTPGGFSTGCVTVEGHDGAAGPA